MGRCRCPQCGKSPLTYVDPATGRKRIALHNDSAEHKCGGSHLTVEDAELMGATGSKGQDELLPLLILGSLTLIVHNIRSLSYDDDYHRSCLAGALAAAEDAAKGLSLLIESIKGE